MKKVEINPAIGKLSKAEQVKWLAKRKKAQPGVDWDGGMKEMLDKSKDAEAEK
jgi:hypothetical protein